MQTTPPVMHSIAKNCSTISLLPQPTQRRWGHHASCNHASNTGGNLSSYFLLHRWWHSEASNYGAARHASAASAKLWSSSSLMAGIAHICDRTRLGKIMGAARHASAVSVNLWNPSSLVAGTTHHFMVASDSINYFYP
jgi:hypothetical protein